MKKKKHFVMLTTYIFGTSRDIIVQTDHTVEEIKADWELREELINKWLIKESKPQDEEIEEWYS